MLKQRIITGVIIAPIALACVFLLPPFEFSLFVAAILIVAGWEWANLGGLSGIHRFIYAALLALAIAGSSLLPLIPLMMAGMVWWLLALLLVVRFPGLESVWGRKPIILMLGFWILLPGWAALSSLKQMPDSGFLICLLFFLIWGADIGAYFSGRALGKRKLAPRVSPGKSWAGFFGGLITALVIAVAMSFWLGRPVLTNVEGWFYLAAAAVVAMISVLGDLSISMFKRHRDIKDSSNLLPGHGGFLDRIDSLLSASPAFVLYLSWANWAS